MKDESRSFKGFDKESIITIMALAIPAMIENILQVLIGTVDTYFIGKIGTEAIAGVGVTNLIMNIYISLEAFSYLPGMGFGVASATLVGQSLGAKKTMRQKNMV